MTHRHLVVHHFLQGRTGACQGQAEAWRIVDVVTADIVTDDGSEVDIDIRLNGAPATEKQVDSTDSWAESDFNGALEAILAPTSDAQFTKKRPASIAKRRAWRYDYSVEQAHSVWHLSYLSAGRMVTWEPAFGGTIWIDQETSRVLSFEMAARNLLESFPMTKVEWTMNYDFVKVGEGNFLLPKHSGADNCQGSIAQVYPERNRFSELQRVRCRYEYLIRRSESKVKRDLPLPDLL